MAIAINGSSNTITGIAVGGLPDGIVDTDMLADDAVTAPKIGSKTFTSYAIICDQKAQNTSGGTFTSGAWQKRDLNTEIADPDGIVSINTDSQFTLQAGSYLIKATCPVYAVDRHQAKLVNATDSTDVAFGTSQYSRNAYTVEGRSIIVCRVTIASAKDFEIRHKCETTMATYGFGIETNYGVEKYTVVEIYKEG